jgi:hypothetical protein
MRLFSLSRKLRFVRVMSSLSPLQPACAGSKCNSQKQPNRIPPCKFLCKHPPRRPKSGRKPFKPPPHCWPRWKPKRWQWKRNRQWFGRRTVRISCRNGVRPWMISRHRLSRESAARSPKRLQLNAPSIRAGLRPLTHTSSQSAAGRCCKPSSTPPRQKCVPCVCSCGETSI